MPEIDITRTELVWPGKYNENGTRREVPRVSLPFQVIETINETRATREAKKEDIQTTLFDVYEGNEGDTFEDGWQNKLIWGDNLLVNGSLLAAFSGRVDLIYIDPPFLMGRDFKHRTLLEDNDLQFQDSKVRSVIEQKAYNDSWAQGRDSYLPMIYDRLAIARDLLSQSGSIYIHLGPNISQYVRPLADELFGSWTFTEIAWKRTNAHGDSKSFGNIHDVILYYRSPDEGTWNEQFYAYDEEYAKRFRHKDSDGRRYMDVSLTAGPGKVGGGYTFEWKGVTKEWVCPIETMREHEEADRLYYTRNGVARRKHYLDEAKGVSAASLWTDISPVNSQANEALGYDTQKPEALLRRVIEASSNPGSIVFDFFCGSGTTLAVAEKLGRRWIGCDLSRWGIHVTRKRLLDIEGCKPFEILNLGKYERQYWQGVTFGKATKQSLTEKALYEYLAFILKLYGAQPVSGMAHLHGKNGKSMIHIGAVDAPVTITEIDDAVTECEKLQQKELHVLGWEWEMGLYDLVVEAARKRGIKLVLLQIPREVMEQQTVEAGEIRFYELAYLEATIKHEKKRSLHVELNDFVIPNRDLIPEGARDKVKKWSDHIDYWAVDWQFQNDTFMQGWVTYRTRKDRKLARRSDTHTYESPGKYRILVKVIDIFGNDTSQAFDVEVK